jgi:ferredoxin-NADP reductase
MNATPRTDAAWHHFNETASAIPFRDFARQLEQERNAARRHADKLATMLADATGYLASVRTDRRYKDPHDGVVYCGQTRDWADGSRQLAERANAMLEAHDEFNLS